MNGVKSENHFVKRSAWLRASVLGANDGIISTTSLAIGVAAASVARDPIILATLAGVVAGALSMAVFAPLKQMIFFQYGFSILFLALSGTLAAKVGGSSIGKSVWRICVWGTIAMVMSALIGYIFGVSMQ